MCVPVLVLLVGVCVCRAVLCAVCSAVLLLLLLVCCASASTLSMLLLLTLREVGETTRPSLAQSTKWGP